MKNCMPIYCFFLMIGTLFAQPNGSPSSSPFWVRGGNTTSSFVSPNILGPVWSGSQLWFTTGGVGYYPMMMMNAGPSVGNGNIGISNDWPNTLTPLDRLHSHITVPGGNYLRFTNPASGVTPTDGYQTGTDATGMVNFNQYEQQPFLFTMRNALGTMQYNKFSISQITQTNTYNPYQPTYTDIARVGIWKTTSITSLPGLAMLHIGVPGVKNIGGHRDWMNLGTYYNTGADYMYTGLKENASSGSDAIIAWGRDYWQAGIGGDRLKFIFTSPISPGLGDAHEGNGVEVARFTSDSSNGRAMLNGPGSPLSDPENTLHVFGQSDRGTAAIPGGNSGVRLANLNAFTPTVSNPGPGVLSVDPNGDLIYVNPTSSSSFGGLCSATAGVLPLAGDWNVPMNGNSVNFTCGSRVPSRVNIGASSCVSASAWFNVYDDTLGTAALFKCDNFDDSLAVASGVQIVSTNYAPGVGSSTGMDITSENYTKGTCTGIRVTAAAYSSSIDTSSVVPVSYGGDFLVASTGNGWQYGISARSQSELTANLDFNCGLFGLAVNQGTVKHNNVGVYGWAENEGTVESNIGIEGIARNYGIIGDSLGSSTSAGGIPGGPVHLNNIGVYGEGDWSGMFTGDVLSIGGNYYASDRKLKDNISQFQNARQLLSALNPVSYTMRTQEYQHLNLTEGKQYGFIAQEVQQVVPELVTEAVKPEIRDISGDVISPREDLLAVNYNGIIAILTAAVQEQQEQISALQEKIDSLLAPAPSNKSSHQDEVHLSEVEAIVLDQNTPNLFHESTVIRYTLPENCKTASIRFFTSSGEVIKTYSLERRGTNELVVYGNDLSGGTYFYSLFVEDVLVSTKKMVKQ